MQDLFFSILIFCVGIFLGWVIASYSNSQRLKKEREHFEGLLQEERRRASLFEEMVKNSKEQFRGLSFQALQESNETFLKMASMTFEKYLEKNQDEWQKRKEGDLKPIRESLDKFNREIQELEKSRLHAYVSLKEQLTSLLEAHKELKVETSTLAGALRSTQIRGRWGEIQLRRVVELAGMVPYCDFVEQKSENTSEGRIRPDLIVHLPGGRKIVVDSKVPLGAYIEAFESSSEEAKKTKLKEHVKQLRSHILALSKKGYAEEIKPAPEFVVLFLPADPFYALALEQDPTLIEASIESKVILATPTTLIALLKAVSFGWKQECLNKNATEIAELGKELYKRLSDVATHFTKLGKNLDSAVESYNKTVGTLESRLLVSARRFKELESEATDEEIEAIEPIEKITREFQSEELIDRKA